VEGRANHGAHMHSIHGALSCVVDDQRAFADKASHVDLERAAFVAHQCHRASG